MKWQFINGCFQDANCGNTLLISLEELVDDGLLKKEELPEPLWATLQHFPYNSLVFLDREILWNITWHPIFIVWYVSLFWRPTDRVNYSTISEIKDPLITKVNNEEILVASSSFNIRWTLYNQKGLENAFKRKVLSVWRRERRFKNISFLVDFLTCLLQIIKFLFFCTRALSTSFFIFIIDK